MRIVLAALVFMVVITSCHTLDRAPVNRVRIGNDVYLSLARQPPEYPKRQILMQTVDSTYKDRRQLFQSVVSMSATSMRVIITLPSGPRVMTIDWSTDGIKVDRSIMVPQGIEAENILADLVIILWDLPSVNAALAGSATASDLDGVRIVYDGDRKVVTVDRRDVTALLGRTEFTNHDFGYRLLIDTVPASET